ncbi:MAG TPA: single-stranded DNA-binding protein [Candidatus Kapabacteria bacterium]|nr:single-stranded DNA-binding protein [Candidatus Kapabacteria bacterium]
MAKSLNKAQLIGNAGKDAEVRYTGTGKPVASFSVATTDSWKDKASGQLQERTEWHNIVAWDRLAEICGEYVKKGTRVYIEGRIQNRSYDDKDGNKRYISEIVASDMMLLSGRPDGGNNSGGGYDQSSSYGGGNNGGGFNTNRGGGNNNSGAAYGAGAAGAPMVPDFGEPVGGSDDDLPF